MTFFLCISSYLTTSRQSPSADNRKYSSAALSWHNSSTFTSESPSSSCLLTLTSALTISCHKNAKKGEGRRKKSVVIVVYFFVMLCLLFSFLYSFYNAWAIKGKVHNSDFNLCGILLQKSLLFPLFYVWILCYTKIFISSFLMLFSLYLKSANLYAASAEQFFFFSLVQKK